MTNRIAATVACAVLAAAVAAPWFSVAWQAAGRATLEIELLSSRDSVATLYVDVGRGMDAASRQRRVVQSGGWRQLRFSLPQEVRAVRLDPIERAGQVSLRGAVIHGEGVSVEIPIPPAAWRPVDGVNRIEVVGGVLEVEASSTGGAPALGIVFARSPVGPPGVWQRVAAVVLLWAILFLPLRLGVALCTRLGEWPSRAAAFARAHAWPSLLGVGLLATLLSSYPVVFLGASWVSPQWSTGLLYESNPALPGIVELREEDPKGADVGAVLWAHLPAARVQAEALAEGVQPFWNRYSAGGSAHLGQGSTFMGTPFMRS